MANKPQTDEEILAEMDKIDELELQGGCAAAPPEAVKKIASRSSNQSKQKKVDPSLLTKD